MWLWQAASPAALYAVEFRTAAYGTVCAASSAAKYSEVIAYLRGRCEKYYQYSYEIGACGPAQRFVCFFSQRLRRPAALSREVTH